MDRFNFTWIRLAALLLTAGFVLLEESSFKLALFYGVVLGHYLLALYYSRQKIRSLTNSLTLGLKMSAVLLIFALGWTFNWQALLPLIVIFAYHHATSETYMLDGTNKASFLWYGPRLIFHLTCYFCLLHHYFWLVDVFWLLLAVWGTFLLLIMSFMSDGLNNARDGIFAETLFALIVMLVLSFGPQIGFLDLVMFHTMMWIFYPGLGLSRRGRPALQYYAVHSLVAYGGCFAVWYALAIGGYLTFAQIDEGMAVFALFHIFTSVMLSNMNLPFLIDFFKIRSRPVAS